MVVPEKNLCPTVPSAVNRTIRFVWNRCTLYLEMILVNVRGHAPNVQSVVSAMRLADRKLTAQSALRLTTRSA